MQPKHDWHKLITLSGNKEVDFQRISKLLEESNIISVKYRTKTVSEGMNYSYHHTKNIKNCKITAHFDMDKPSGVLVLKNAWVEKQ